jgi:hypothetical protein
MWYSRAVDVSNLDTWLDPECRVSAPMKVTSLRWRSLTVFSILQTFEELKG